MARPSSSASSIVWLVPCSAASSVRICQAVPCDTCQAVHSREPASDWSVGSCQAWGMACLSCSACMQCTETGGKKLGSCASGLNLLSQDKLVAALFMTSR